MIGLHRNLARKGDRIQVSGTLEQVEHLKTGKESYQIVVGSGTCENEYIKPFVCVTAQ
jgi:predicted nucleotidyltransferase